MQVETLFSSIQEDKAATSFCIVHWNAPDFLKLNLEKLRAYHPESKVYVFDNHSTQENLDAAVSASQRYTNVTFFSCKNDYSHMWDSLRYSMGLQFLLNYSATQSDSLAVFLDQDCILSDRVDG